MADGDGGAVESGSGPVESTGNDHGDTAGSESDSTLDRLFALQRVPRRRGLATAGALVLGVLLGTVHWAGLLVGGALVGLCQPTLGRALVAGLGFGVAVLAVVTLRFALAGTLGAVLGTWPLVGVGVAVALVAGPVGALARGLFEDAPLEE
jgi:hypothetical protein